MVRRLTRSQHAAEPDIGSESRFLLTAPAFDAPVRGWGVPVGTLPCRLVSKIKRFRCPMVKKFEDTIIRFDRMYERDRQTDGGQTDRHRFTAHAALA